MSKRPNIWRNVFWSGMNAKSVVIWLGVFVGIFAIDVCLSLIADKRVRDNDYYFSKAIKASDLDLDGDFVQNCHVESELIFYLYKTCFQTFNKLVDGGSNEFYFKYASPQPLLLGGGKNDAYHLQAMSIAQSVKIIHANGKVEDIQE